MGGSVTVSLIDGSVGASSHRKSDRSKELPAWKKAGSKWASVFFEHNCMRGNSFTPPFVRAAREQTVTPHACVASRTINSAPVYSQPASRGFELRACSTTNDGGRLLIHEKLLRQCARSIYMCVGSNDANVFRAVNWLPWQLQGSIMTERRERAQVIVS